MIIISYLPDVRAEVIALQNSSFHDRALSDGENILVEIEWNILLLTFEWEVSFV